MPGPHACDASHRRVLVMFPFFMPVPPPPSQGSSGYETVI